MTHLAYVPRRDARPRRVSYSVVAGLVALSSLAACSNSTGLIDGGGSRISFTTGGSAVSAANRSVIPVTKNGHTLDVTHITVVVARASLKRDHSSTCLADNEDDDDDGLSSSNRGECGEVRLAPAIVDLPVDGKVVTLPGGAVPAGTFSEIEVRVSLVRLQGTFDAKPFDVTIEVNAKSEIEFETPIVVTDATPPSVTVNLPVDTWLVSADGSLVDPSKLASTPSLMTSVRNRIAASLRAFEDNDCDGHEDHNRGKR